ncbi:MAG: hypothetical protein ACTSRA_00715 [Promethearchaeota archaeon]|nr:MAG: hypothetical protein [Helarchaeota virus Nidhogg Meg22_1012]URC17480.1 MAG: hypothetical protein [Helarchaeota virus Nidhogg Meg22_1214]
MKKIKFNYREFFIKLHGEEEGKKFLTRKCPIKCLNENTVNLLDKLNINDSHMAIWKEQNRILSIIEKIFKIFEKTTRCIFYDIHRKEIEFLSMLKKFFHVMYKKIVGHRRYKVFIKFIEEYMKIGEIWAENEDMAWELSGDFDFLKMNDDKYFVHELNSEIIKIERDEIS